MFKVNGYHALTLPIHDIIEELAAFEKMIAGDENGYPLVEYHGKRTSRIFDINRMPDSLYKYIITDEVIDMLTGYWGRDAFLFDAVFMYASAQSKPQPVHRDVHLMELAPITLLFDIVPTAIATLFIAKSHRSATPSQRLAVPLSTQHNAVLFNCFIEHHGAATVAQSCKLSLTFIPKWRDEHERQCYAQHSHAFGVSDRDKKLRGQTLPLIPLRRIFSSI
jgi:hypothetical protein